jgi:hypothetical protein
MLNHTVRAGIHQALVAVLGSHPVGGRAVHAQHLDDLDNSIMLPDDPAVHQKMVTDASVHNRPRFSGRILKHAGKPHRTAAAYGVISQRGVLSVARSTRRSGRHPRECWDAPPSHLRCNPRDRCREYVITAASAARGGETEGLAIERARALQLSEGPKGVPPAQGLSPRGPLARHSRLRTSTGGSAIARTIRPDRSVRFPYSPKVPRWQSSP